MKPKKIAIIDDEPDIVTYLSSALQDEGFEVCSASNANDGFELVRSQKPHLVCLDILMPEETGCSLYRRLKNDRSLEAIPILIISGLNLDKEMAKLLGDNGETPVPNGYIEKPIDLPHFLDTVKHLTMREEK